MADPTPPYQGYLERIAARITAGLQDAQPPPAAFAGAPEPVVRSLTAEIERHGDALVALSHDLHAHPELAYEEHESVRRVARLLEEQGYEPDVGAFGIDTALRAIAGEGRPRVAVLAEYDALPEIGHACGHNVICATAVGAFLGLAPLAADLGGSVALYGCPAEEGGGGKELMAKAGAFDEVDAAIMLHPGGFEVSEHPWLGLRTVDVTYRGITAHASILPFLGRNALDGLVQAYTGVAALRQHMLPSDRVHGIITDGGQRPNIVPDRAAGQFLLRSAEPDTLRELSDRAREIFEAAAGATGTVVQIDWDPMPVYLPVRHSTPLAQQFGAHLAERGRAVLPPGVVPPYYAASTDMGNVSVRVPSIHPYLKISPPGVSPHNPEFARHAVGDEADRGCVDGAIGLARTAADFLADGDLRKAAAQAFEDDGGVVDVDALLA